MVCKLLANTYHMVTASNEWDPLAALHPILFIYCLADEWLCTSHFL
jgi:hypothetical protein